MSFFLLLNLPTAAAKGLQPEIVLAGGAFHAVEEGGDFNQLVPGVEEIKVKNLLPCHINLQIMYDCRRISHTSV